MASRFDLKAMNGADRRVLASAFCEAVRRFYEDPANVARFEEWKKTKEEKA